MTSTIVHLRSEKNNNVIPEHVCLSKHGGFCKRKLYRKVQASLQSSHLEQHKYLFWMPLRMTLIWSFVEKCESKAVLVGGEYLDDLNERLGCWAGPACRT